MPQEQSIKEILAQNGFKFTKSLGQNFLYDKKILEKIIQDAKLEKGDCVLEIGPGAGTLTRLMAAKGANVTAVEIDRALEPVLKQTLSGCAGAEIIYADFLKLDILSLYNERLKPGFKVVANIPYYITTPIIMRLLESGLPYKSVTVLVQRDVALRMAAQPGTSSYGALSCAVQYYTQPLLKSRIGPGSFYPPPKVESQVITLEKRDKPPVQTADEELLFKVIKCAFAMRRKTFLNNLTSAFGLTRTQAEELLISARLPIDVRGEKLSLNDMAKAADYIFKLAKGG